MLAEQLPVSSAGELGSAIGVDDEVLRVVTLADSHAQGGNDQRGVEKLAHGPTDDAPAKDIQDSDQIQPALSGEYASDVSGPDLIRPSHHESTQSVGSDRSAVPAVGGAWDDTWSVVGQRVAPGA